MAEIELPKTYYFMMLGVSALFGVFLFYMFTRWRTIMGVRKALRRLLPMVAFWVAASTILFINALGGSVPPAVVAGVFLVLLFGPRVLEVCLHRFGIRIGSAAVVPAPPVVGSSSASMTRVSVERGEIKVLDEEVEELEASQLRDADLPQYWTNKRGGKVTNFDQMVYVAEVAHEAFEEMLKKTYCAIATQDRPCPKPAPNTCRKTPGGCPCIKPGGDPGLPTSYVVRRIIRVEDAKMWARYVDRRTSIQENRTGNYWKFDPLVMTDEIAGTFDEVFETLDTELNEVYLWHGTSVRTALAIAQNDFNIDLAGTSFGTMYGAGAYLAESCTKADEYSYDEPGGYYDGIFAMILCRVCMGKFYYTTSRDTEAGDKVASGEFDSTLGDRSKSVHTFREFVVYNADQLYPEYIVLYSRVHRSDDEALVRKAASTPFHMELPVYWANCHVNPHGDQFCVQYRVRQATANLLQRLVAGAISCDTQWSGIRLVEALRVEDSEMWSRYVEFKRSLQARLQTGDATDENKEVIRASPVADTRSSDDWIHFLESCRLSGKVSRLHFVCEWKDQDWGNTKGSIKVCLVSASGAKVVERELFGTCRSDGVKGWKKAERVFRGDEPIIQKTGCGMRFQLSYRVGGGGGHQLYIKNLVCTLQYMNIDDVSIPAMAHCVPANELDGDPESGQSLTTTLLGELNAEDGISLENLDASLNELLLWHGTNEDAATAIAKGGFHIPRGERAKHGKRFGEGAYFAEALAKSLDYAVADRSGLYYVLLCRITCGEFYYTESSTASGAHNAAQAEGKDSVLANPMKAGPREYIVLDESQVYPEFILHLKLV